MAIRYEVRDEAGRRTSAPHAYRTEGAIRGSGAVELEAE